MNRVKRFLSTALCALTILGSVVGVTGLVYAGNSKLDVTASNMTGVTSKDPYSLLTQKDDNDQNFYVKLTSLSNGNAMSFISYSFIFPPPKSMLIVVSFPTFEISVI